ncbi:MAG TPA: entericidin A/B family lipoprotein [Opitutus sp.]|nr:entericidin A/B family lipoprotein [Opitutus sp.]
MNIFNKTHLRRFSVLALLASVLGFAASGCRTMDGAGQDIERAGEKIQENAR